MNRNEVKQILAVLEMAYPNWIANKTTKQKNDLIDLWCDMFTEDDPIQVGLAVKGIIKTDCGSFPPSIGAIRQRAYDMSHPVGLSETEAWATVTNALRNCIHRSAEEYAKLPKEVQLVVTPDLLKEWAILNVDELQTVVASGFMRSYRSRVVAYRQNEILPDGMKTMIGELKQMYKIESGDE